MLLLAAAGAGGGYYFYQNHHTGQQADQVLDAMYDLVPHLGMRPELLPDPDVILSQPCP